MNCQAEACINPAQEKCTRCGRVFCKLHIRHGNPRFAFGKLFLDGGYGNYCDTCWQELERQSKLEHRLAPFVLIAAAVVAGLLLRWLIPLVWAR